MRVGQRIEVRPKRGLAKSEGTEIMRGTIIIIERRYIVVQFEDYRGTYLISDVQHNIGRKFTLLDGGGRIESKKEVGTGL